MPSLDDVRDFGESKMSSRGDILDAWLIRMPRPARTDLKPEIWLDDNSEEESALKKHVSGNKILRLYSNDRDTIGYISKFLHFDPEFFDDLQLSLGPHGKFDGNLVLKLLRFVHRSKVEPVRDPKTLGFIVKDGKQLWRLETLGCRSSFKTQELLAESIERSRDHVVQHMKLLKDADIIVNSGHGFVDFNADLVWKGPHSHQIAFVRQFPQPGYFKLY